MPPLIRLAVGVEPESSCTALAPSKRNDVFCRFFVRRPKPSYCRLALFNVATWFRAFHKNGFAPSKGFAIRNIENANPQPVLHSNYSLCGMSFGMSFQDAFKSEAVPTNKK